MSQKNVTIDGGTDDTPIGNRGSQLSTDDTANVTGVYASLTVGTSAVLLKVGGSALDNRKYVTMQTKADAVYWGYDSSVTTSTGTQIFKDQLVVLPVGPSVTIYLIANGSGRDVRIGEIA